MRCREAARMNPILHQLTVLCCTLAICALTLRTTPADARVVRFSMISRTPIAFGYDKIVGRLFFTDDPNAAANARIIDLGLAPHNRAGLVESSADVVILAPHAPSENASALIDIPNRGGARALIFNLGNFGGGPNARDDYGDGFLMRHGFISVSIGWQFDVPREPGLMRLRAPVATEHGRPIYGLVRSDFTVNEQTAEANLANRNHVPYPVANVYDATNVLTERDEIIAPRRTIPRRSWQFTHANTEIALDGGFIPGKIYELVYRAGDPVVSGLGLAAIRDTVSFLKHDSTAPAHIAHAYGFGISQSGRVLRTMIVQKFDSDENGQPVFDGIMPVVSGPALGSFNYRFAQPSRDAAAFSSFFYPTDIPPFHEAQWPLPPELKVINIVTSHEYWGRTASLMTTTENGGRDIVLPANVRFYAMTGGMHNPNLPPFKLPGVRNRSNPLDYRYAERAMLVHLDEWVRSGLAPPPSKYPRVDDGTLVKPERWTFPAIPGMIVVDPLVALHHTWRYDFGKRWTAGIEDLQPPIVGPLYTTLIPAVDADGIDRAGIRLPEVGAPLATYTGWNLRTPEVGFENHLIDFIGSFVPFAKTRHARIAGGDGRPSIEERYVDKDGWLRAYDGATDSLIAQRYVLPEDKHPLHNRALKLWDEL